MRIEQIAVAALLLGSAVSAFAGTTLDRVRGAHSLSCGVIKEEEDYSRATDHGNRAAFDIDLCKAAAVATLGPGAAFTVKPYPDEPAGIKALKKGEIDLLPTASPTLRNETANGLAFARPVFYDAQGFLIPNSAAIHSARDLAGKKICYLTGSVSGDALHAWAAREHLDYIWYPFSEAGEMEAAFFTGNCAGVTSDVSYLANLRGIDSRRAHDFTILPDHIRKDPLAPAFLEGDPQFAAIVRWTVDTLIEAEEQGVTQANLAQMKASADPDVQALLGRPLGTGALLGLDPKWSTNVLQAVGNYGEIWERDLGAGSPLRLDRQESRLWTHGGLMYALPAGQ